MGFTTDDEDRLVEAVRLVRPERRALMPAKAYAESAWEAVDEVAWREAWDAEVAAADPFVTRPLILATGLLLPVWKSLPARRTFVRRLKAPDGRRWLGRVLDEADLARLRIALGLSDTAAAVADGAAAGRLLLDENVSLSLGGSLWLRRARVMDRWRIEVVGAGGERAAFQALGCAVEIINYTPRVFVPVGDSAVLSAILARWPAQTLLPAAA